MLGNVIMNITAKISKMNDDTMEETDTEKSIFKLPIEYLDENERFMLQDTVCDDLELIVPLKEDIQCENKGEGECEN